MTSMTSSGMDGEQTQEQHQGIISHAAEKFHLKKPTRAVAEKTVRSRASFSPGPQPPDSRALPLWCSASLDLLGNLMNTEQLKARAYSYCCAGAVWSADDAEPLLATLMYANRAMQAMETDAAASGILDVRPATRVSKPLIQCTSRPCGYNAAIPA